MTARFIISHDQAFAKEVDGVRGGGGGGGERFSMQMIKNFTPANNILSFFHQGFAGLTLFDMGFLNRQSWGGMRVPYHNFVPMIMKFATGIELDVFYTMVTKNL